MSEPRTGALRHKWGIRHPRLQDRRCRRKGHRLSNTITVGMRGGAYWPLCERCGYAVEPSREAAQGPGTVE